MSNINHLQKLFSLGTMLILAGSLVSASSQSASPDNPLLIPQVVESGPNHNVWEYVTQELDANGKMVEFKHSFTQLESGLNRFSQADNAYIAASPRIISENGQYLTDGGAHQATWANDAADARGTVDLVLPDGQHVREKLLGIAYTDIRTGKSLFVTELASASPAVDHNYVWYTNALAGGFGNLRYTFNKGSLERDIVLTSRLPDPSSIAMDPKNIAVEIWTEFLECPEPSVEVSHQAQAGGLARPDDRVSFGSMHFGAGRGFSLGSTNVAHQDHLHMTTEWLKLENRSFLVEAASFAELDRRLQLLPRSQVNYQPQKRQPLIMANTQRARRAVPAKLANIMSTPTANKRTQMIAQASQAKGFVLDYTLLAGAANFVFQGDKTYFVSGAVALTGTNTVIQGGTIIKFNTNSSANIAINSTAFECDALPYRHAVFTSKDDDTIGDKISGSTGLPSGYYGTGLTVNAATLRNCRFLYANHALNVLDNNPLTLQDCQFVNCLVAVFSYYSNIVSSENVLFANVNTIVE